MGFASFLEDIADRYTDSTHELSRWERYAQHARLEREASRRFEEGTGARDRDLESPLQVFASHLTDSAQWPDLVKEFGDPFEWPKRLVERIVEYARGRGASALLDSRWQVQITKLHAVHEALKPLSSSSPSLDYLALTRSVEQAIESSLAEGGKSAMLNHGAIAQMIEHIEPIKRTADRFLSDLEEFERAVGDLSPNEVGIAGLRDSVASLRRVSKQLDEARMMRDHLQQSTAQVRELWARFLAIRIAVEGAQRPRPEQLTRALLSGEQDQIVAWDIAGHARVIGASGSGKTIALVHRTLRLAANDPNASILLLTLDRSLTGLLDELVKALSVTAVLHNVRVTSLFDLLLEGNQIFTDLSGWRSVYSIRTIYKEVPATIAWCDFFGGFGKPPNARLTADPRKLFGSNRARAIMKPITGTSLYNYVRGRTRSNEDASRYIRDEVRWVQGSFAPGQREEYLKSETARRGRAFGLEVGHRMVVLNAVEAWERFLQMRKWYDQDSLAAWLASILESSPVAVDKLRDRVGCDYLLVDEAQDLSTVDLWLLQRFLRVPSRLNGLFLVGDARQQVYGRAASARRAGLSFSGRSRVLHKSHRNTQQILRAATAVAMKYPPPAMKDELVEAELSEHAGPRPLVIEAPPRRQLEVAVEMIAQRSLRRIGVLCNDDELLHALYMRLCADGQEPMLLVPNGMMDRTLPPLPTSVTKVSVVMTDFANSKGMEFDTVIMLGVSADVCPMQGVPRDEWWRSAAMFYVAATRARDELIILHGQTPSPFIAAMAEHVDSRTMPSIESVDVSSVRAWRE